MNTRTKLLAFALLAVTTFALGGCSDDDDPAMPAATGKTFTVTIANISPSYDHFGSGVFNTPVGASAPAPLASVHAPMSTLSSIDMRIRWLIVGSTRRAA